MIQADIEIGKALICLVGLPRSGKSTWAKSQAWPIVNPDAVRLAIHGQRFITEAEPFVWATVRAMVKALFLAGHNIVILDATNTTRKRRDEWLSNEWVTYFARAGAPADAPACLPKGFALGTVDLVDILPVEKVVKRISDQERAFGDYSPGRYAWKLENPKPFPYPIPTVGRQGFFWVKFHCEECQEAVELLRPGNQNKWVCEVCWSEGA